MSNPKTSRPWPWRSPPPADFEEAATTQQALLDAARGRAEPGLISHLEYNLARYRQGQASDRPWLVETPDVDR